MKETNIVALEIGSSKIKGAVGVIDASGAITVKAVEEEPHQDWVRYGIVSNVEEVASLAVNLIERLEQRVSPLVVEGVYVSMGGRSFRSDSREAERILPDETEINADIIEQLMGETSATVFNNRELLDIVPREYIVDKARVTKPIGTFGRNIRMLSNVITCRPQIKRNLCRLLNEKLGLNINGFVVRQTAQAEFVLNPEEKRLGCMLVDCGAETTTVSIYKNGTLQYLSTLPMGSRNITRDLTSLNFVEEQAEDIKQRFGNAQNSPQPEAVASAPGINMQAVQQYVSARAGEIIANIKEQLKYAGFKSTDLPGGAILVGRGARLRGFSERLADSTGMKVRTGNSARLDLRLADSRIAVGDSVDVIATLYYAAKHSPIECLSVVEEEVVPEPVRPKPEPRPVNPEPRPEPVTVVSEPEPVNPVVPTGGVLPGTPKKEKGGLFRKLSDKFRGLIEEPDDYDDDIMREDKD
ncbi:MAG: hypothetical protein NC043_05570 [Muribaculaceae bacterium]|nr:hypothetical protein [Muribaculaceae bacterium]